MLLPWWDTLEVALWLQPWGWRAGRHPPHCPLLASPTGTHSCCLESPVLASTSNLKTLSQHFSSPCSSWANQGRAAAMQAAPVGCPVPRGEPSSPSVPSTPIPGCKQGSGWDHPACFSLHTPAKTSTRSQGQEACSLTHSQGTVSWHLSCVMCPPLTVQQHQLAKHVAKYLLKQQRSRRRWPGNSSALRKILADLMEETSLEKPHEKDCSWISQAVTT